MLPADKMRVHDAYGSGAQNRLRENSTISFAGNTHADVAESRLFFGPYLHLEPGDYSFRFRGTLDGSLRLRFTKAFGAECLREVVVTDFDVPVQVSVEAPAEKFEIIGERLKNMKAMTLSSIELAVEPLASGPIRRPALKPKQIFECSIAQLDSSNPRLGPISVKSGAEIETGASFSLIFVPIL